MSDSDTSEKAGKAKSEEVQDAKNDDFNIGWHLLVLFAAIALGFAVGSSVQIDSNHSEKDSTPSGQQNRPTYWVFSQYSNVDDPDGIMKHVHLVLGRLGFVKGTNRSDWDLLWSHDYPFRSLFGQISSLKSHQLVNHFPGTGFITNKVDFATTESEYIPKAFKIPEDVVKFKEYAAQKPNSLFVQKDNQHRGVVIKNVTEIDFDKGSNFIQEYVTKPYLVDGHKFDIGVYTVITSVDPLRVYIYKGDILFRYCPSKYYPFDPLDLDKYVIGDDYLPTWEVPSLAPFYTAMGFGMRDSFEAYVRSKGQDPSKIWLQIEEFLGEIFRKKEHHIISGLKNYRSGLNFFEMMRFDFVIDEDLNVYALEANMSPNLSSAHFPPNQLLYEQVLFSILSLVGVAKYTHSSSLADINRGESSMKVSDKNLAVWPDNCGSEECRVTCEGVCGTCRHCLSQSTRQAFTKTVLEQMNRNDCKRVYPAPMTQGVVAEDAIFKDVSGRNLLMHMWLQGKCNQDKTWCN